MALLKNKKQYLLTVNLKAATLMEALIALILIMFCFVIGSMIYVNVVKSDNNRQELNANLLLHEITLKTIQEKKFIDEKIENENMTIQKTVTQYKNTNNLNLLTLTASDKKGRILAQHKELMVIQ